MILESMQAFFSSPFNVTITIAAIIFSGIFFILSRKNEISAKTKVAFVFLHLVLLVFPIYYFGLETGCGVPILNCDLKTVATFIPIGLGVIFVLGFFLAPLVYMRSNKELKGTGLNSFVKLHSRKLGIKTPKIYLLDTAKPVAYSFSNFSSAIFVSAGMIELMNEKEMEAVLLHELGHVKQGSSLKKFSTMFLKTISPLSAFTSFGKELTAEEHSADEFAANAQGSWRSVTAAKMKINAFNGYKE